MLNEESWISWSIHTSRRWSDINSVLKYINIDFIDYDHQLLVKYTLKLNQIIDSVEKNFSLEDIKEIQLLIKNLFDYATEHFEREESFMDTYKLPNIEIHKKEHDQILTMLNQYLEDFSEGKIKITANLKAQLMEWLINHINKTDYEFFKIENWSHNILNASNWDDVKAIIRQIGVGEIDKQHQVLTVIALNTMKNIEINPIDNVINSECKLLKDYALYHFQYEHEFMKKYGIPDVEIHLDQHDYFINTIDDYSIELKQNIKIIEDIKIWTLTWWINHINTVDRDYFGYSNWAYGVIEKAETLGDVEFILRKIGIEKIDNEHLKLMEMTMDLNSMIKLNEKNGVDYIKNEKSRIEILDVINKIYEYATYHFDGEEEIMKKNHMKEFQNHHAEHAEILKQLLGIKENFVNKRLYPSSNIKTIILEWWIEHTNNTDYRTFVKSN